MSVSLNNVSLSDKQGSGPAAGTAASGKGGASEAQGQGGFQDLLAVLLDLLSAQTGSNGSSSVSDAASAVASATTSDQSSSVSLDLGGLLDLKALLQQMQANPGAEDAAADGTDTPDPLATILDVLIASLQKASGESGNGGQLTLDGTSRDALKTLNALLANLTNGASDKAPAHLPNGIVDKLATLDQMLAGLDGDPELADLKTRVAELIGRGADANKPANSDPTTQSVAALLGQNGTDKTGNTQRDTMVHLLDGARTALNTDKGSPDANTGDPGNKNPSQAQAQADAARNMAAAKQDAAAGFAAQTGNDAKTAAQKSDGGPDPVPTLPGQAADKAQQMQFRAIQAAYTQSGSRIDLPQVAFDIARHAVAGISRFQIRLDPPEMGRIDVRLDIDKTGGLTARLTVDKPETFDMLQRDARALERALAQTGLDQGKTNLEFSLRQNPFAGQNFNQGQRDDAQAWFGDTEEASTAEATPIAVPVTHYRGSVRPGGVNLVA